MQESVSIFWGQIYCHFLVFLTTFPVSPLIDNKTEKVDGSLRMPCTVWAGWDDDGPCHARCRLAGSCPTGPDPLYVAFRRDKLGSSYYNLIHRHLINGGWHFTKVAFHQSGISTKQHFTKAAFHQSGISRKRHFTKVAFHQSGILPKQHFTKVAFHQMHMERVFH